MLPLYTEDEYLQAKSTSLLKLQCYQCNKEFTALKKTITQELTEQRGRCKFCSTKCNTLSQTRSVTVNCLNCNKKFIKTNNQVIKFPNHFCSRSCAATYNNTHKTTGNRRSKLEIYIEKQLKSLYPKLCILFNDKQTINSELDIYIPSLKLAFELNGIYHYEPIHGQNKLDKIVNNDNRKQQACNENNISLCIIDTSQQKYFKEQNCIKYLDIITKIINSLYTQYLVTN